MNSTKPLPNIDFANIRVLENSKNKGFEELAVQLFRSSFPQKTTFYRVDDAGGDGGVEDIAVVEKKRKIGLQAKYFNKLGAGQWTQINRSVRTALKNHAPDLIEYRIITSVNRSKDIKNWDNYKAKWVKYTRELGYTKNVEFIWHGETDIREELIKEEHRSRLHYWFGCKRFSDDWLLEKYKSTRKLLDTRYTPEHHVRTDTEQKLDAFFHTESFIKSFKKKLFSLCLSWNKFYTNVDSSINSTAESINTALLNIQKLFANENCLPSFSEIIKVLQTFIDHIYDSRRLYLNLREEKEAKKENLNHTYYHSRAFSDELTQLDKIRSLSINAQNFIQKYSCYDKQFILLQGEAGVGKSHLLANSIKSTLDRKQPCLLLAGEQFLTGIAPLEQLCQNIGWEDGYEALLSAFNIAAEVQGKPAVIAIDALNESEERKLWKSHLISLSTIIEKYTNIRLIVSCRTDFSKFVLPKTLFEDRDDKWELLYHYGFEFEIFEAIDKYFNSYGIQCMHFPPLHEEFQNPLFLKTFCEAYQGKTIPHGTISFDTVMKERLKYCQTIIQDSINCPEYKTKEALNLIASAITNNNGGAVSLSLIRPQIDKLFDGGGENRSLYIHLKSNGMFVETINTNEEIMVRFPYEKFSDYFIASKILDVYKKSEDLKKDWKKMNLPDYWIEDFKKRHQNRGLLRMMAILIPERFGCELINLFRSDTLPIIIYEDFLTSLPWRTEGSITNVTVKLFKECSLRFEPEEYLNYRLRLLTIPKHPLNSLLLHNRLASMELPERELAWTIPISNLTSRMEQNAVDDIIRWVFKVPAHLVSKDQTWLVAIFLTWLLTSNYRLLRHRASLALIKILNGQHGLAVQLIKEFHDCNDPYVVERIYAAACGVALRECDKEALKKLAIITFEKMFSGDSVQIHVLQRDYAQLIMERASYKGILPGEIDIKKCRPIFKSKEIQIISEQEDVALSNSDGWSSISASLKPETAGYYGDFGRYIMDYAIHNFSSQKLNEKYLRDDRYENTFKGIDARRYILFRIKQLGWVPELFDKYERNLIHGRLRVDEEEIKIERISKKYQWIGLHELLGNLSDHFWMLPDYSSDKPEPFEGAWQIHVQDFDPTQPLIDPKDNLQLEESEDSFSAINDPAYWHGYPDPFSDIQLKTDREAWVSTTPDDFQTLIEHNALPDEKYEWLTLHCHFNWKEPLGLSQDENKDGQLKMWADLRCWLVKKEDKIYFLQCIDKIKFYGSGCFYPKLYDRRIGEYPWSSSCKDIDEEFKHEEWLRGCPIEVVQTFCGYNEQFGITSMLPAPVLFNILGLAWAGKEYNFLNNNGECLVIYKDFESCGSPLLIRRNDFLKATEEAGFIPFWAILSERSCYSLGSNRSIVKKWAFTQRVYGYESGKIVRHQDEYYEIPLY